MLSSGTTLAFQPFGLDVGHLIVGHSDEGFCYGIKDGIKRAGRNGKILVWQRIIAGFDPSRPSHALTRPKSVVIFSAKSLHFRANFAYEAGLKNPKIGNFGENLPIVSNPNRRNSRFRGDDCRRPVRSALRGRAGSCIPAILLARRTANVDE